MSIADAFLAAVVVLAGVAGVRIGATNALASLSGASAGLVVGARVAEKVHWGSGSARQIGAAIVLVGCGVIGLAGGQLRRTAPSTTLKPQIPAVVRRRRRRRWVGVGKVAATLLVGALGGFLIARATESAHSTLTAAPNTTVPVTEATAASTTTTGSTTTAVTATSPSTIGIPTTPAVTPTTAPPVTAVALTVTSPADGTLVRTSRVTLAGTADPGVVVKVGTAAVTAAPDTTWRLVVRLTEGDNLLVVSDGSSSVTITIVSHAPATTTTAPPTTIAGSTTTTIPIDTEPRP